MRVNPARFWRQSACGHFEAAFTSANKAQLQLLWKKTSPKQSHFLRSSMWPLPPSQGLFWWWHCTDCTICSVTAARTVRRKTSQRQFRRNDIFWLASRWGLFSLKFLWGGDLLYQSFTLRKRENLWHSFHLAQKSISRLSLLPSAALMHLAERSKRTRRSIDATRLRNWLLLNFITEKKTGWLWKSKNEKGREISLSTRTPLRCYNAKISTDLKW